MVLFYVMGISLIKFIFLFILLNILIVYREMNSDCMSLLFVIFWFVVFRMFRGRRL